jgi:hypothetical protein
MEDAQLSKHTRLCVLVVVCLIVTGAPVKAQVTTYSYQANPYFYVELSSPSVCPLGGFFTTLKPLPPNAYYTYNDNQLIPASFSFTDCFNTITDKNNIDGLAFYVIGTDNQGNINQWNIFLENNIDVLINGSFTAFYGFLSSWCCQGDPWWAGDFTDYSNDPPYGLIAHDANWNLPGTWTATSGKGLSIATSNRNPVPSILTDNLKKVPVQPTIINVIANLPGVPDGTKIDFSAKVEDVLNAGGHLKPGALHDPTQVPVGQFNPPKGKPFVLGQKPIGNCKTTGGSCPVQFVVSELSGKYTITALLDSDHSVSSGPFEIDVAVPSLTTLPPGTTYVADGLWGEKDVTSQHTATHNGTQTLITDIQTVASMYFAQSKNPPGQSLGINDMSLPWGGLFDINNIWAVAPKGHKSHRLGNGVDIDHFTYAGGTKGPSLDPNLLDALMTANGMYNIPEGKSIHYQVNGTLEEKPEIPGEIPKRAGVAAVSATHVVANVLHSGDGLFTYNYFVTNGPMSAADIADFKVDISRSSIGEELSTNGIVQGSGSLVEYQTAVLARSTSVPTIPAGLSSPPGWLGMIGVDGFAKWSSQTEPNSLKPGESGGTYQIQSPGLPGIRQFQARPYLRAESLSLVPPINDLDAPRYEAELRAFQAAASFSGVSVGPTAPPAEFMPSEFLIMIQQYKAVADRVGWIRDPSLSRALQEMLQTAQLALTKKQTAEAKASIQRIFVMLDRSPNNALSAEADALLRFNMEYLLRKLN